MLVCMLHQAHAASDPACSVELLLGDAYDADSSTRIEHGTLGRQAFSGAMKTGVPEPRLDRAVLTIA
jgi:hypothetical protein